MEDHNALSIFPKTRLKPYDGMSVTADVWAQSHDEHRRARQAHDLFLHGSGIICGLEVTANDPPDSYVFVSPGAAIDPAGNVIVIEERVAYDFGDTVEGPLYLMLGYGEREAGGVENEVKQMHSEFMIAARPSLPRRPAVELARVFLPGLGAATSNARNPAHPAAGELDLRFRTCLAAAPRRPAQVGLIRLGKADTGALAGWDFLSAESARSGYPLVIDAVPTVDERLTQYDFVYASASGAFKLTAAESKALQSFRESGKTLFAEALTPEAADSFAAAFASLGITLGPLPESVLQHPFLFGAPPPGGVAGGQVQAGRQVIFSTFAYSQAWQGRFAAANPGRAEIRAAHEFGVNLLAFILNRPTD